MASRPMVFVFLAAAIGMVISQEATEIGTKLADSTSAVGTSTVGSPTVAEAADKPSGNASTEFVPEKAHFGGPQIVDTRQSTNVTEEGRKLSADSNSITEASTGDISASTSSDSLTPRGRALNLTFDDSISRLDDVTMEEDDELHKDKKKPPTTTLHSVTSEMTTPAVTSTTVAEEFCVHGEERYKMGQSFDKGCLETCLCGQGGLIGCQPKCKAPYVPAGSNKDETCMERPTLEADACCVTLVCTAAVTSTTTTTTSAASTTTDASATTEASKQPAMKEEGCSYKDGHHKIGEEFNDGCEAACYCEEAGHISCKPRCPPKVHNMTSDRCVAVPDPNDSCCMVVLCDVSIQEHDVHRAGDIDMDDVELLSASILNSTSVKLETSQAISNFSVEVNSDKEWRTANSSGSTVTGLEPGTAYKLRIRHKGDISNEISVALPVAKKSTTCDFKGKTYARGEEFHDECRAFCTCGKTGVECANIECPSDFGLDVLDPHCIEWETHPPGFTPVPPHCCPEKMVCKRNGSCLYEGQSFPNWSEIPTKVTGCENRCFCDNGNVTCQRVCPVVPKVPPSDLPCTAKEAALLNIPGDDCCVFWQCPMLDPLGNKTSESDMMTTTPDTNINYMAPPLIPQKPDVYKDYHKSKPYGDSKNNFDKKDKEKEKEKEKYHNKNSTKHDANFLGPFNPNYYQQKNATKHDLIDDMLEPFHLQDYAQEIKDHLKNNKTTDEYEDYQDNNGGIEHEQDPYLGNKKNIWGIGQKPGIPFKQSDIYYPGKQPPHDPLLLHELGPYQNNKLHGRPENPLVHPGIGGKHNPNQILQDLGGGFPPKGIKPAGRPDPSNPLLNGDTNPDGGLYHHQYLPSQDIYNPRLPSKYEEQELSPHSDKEIIHIHSDHPLRVEDILTHIKNQDRPGTGLTHPHFIDPAHAYNPSAHLHQVEGLNKGFNGQHFPPGFPPRTQQHEPNEIKVHTLEALDESTVRLVFSVPAVFVGLHGRVELRYTSEKDNNEPSSWEQQVLAPPGDLIATPELEFELGGLEADTFYKIKISVVLRDIQNIPSSQILSVKTPPSTTASTTLPPVIPVQADLRAVEVNSTWAKISWRKFTDFELQFIDGVQLRYKELDGKVYAATPLIHRAVTVYTIEDLRSDATYEVGIFFIPFPGQSTELQAHNTIHISTTIENDPYKFELVLDLHHLKYSSVEVSWNGVPYPEDKYVNIFRILYQSEGGKEDFSQFKLAKRDLPSTNLITELKPNTRYRLWLEAYLTNGRIKKSNVKDFVTKAGPSTPLANTQQGKLEATPLVEAHDYYGPLVVVSILAALAIVSTLILLLILAKKHGHNKAPITAVVRKPQQSAAYDNPSYKTSDNDMEGGKRTNGVHIPMTIMQPSA